GGVWRGGDGGAGGMGGSGGLTAIDRPGWQAVPAGGQASADHAATSPLVFANITKSAAVAIVSDAAVVSECFLSSTFIWCTPSWRPSSRVGLHTESDGSCHPAARSPRSASSRYRVGAIGRSRASPYSARVPKGPP